MTSETRGKPRARDLGLPFPGIPGRWNAITDVPGVEVGYTTLIKGEGEVQIGKGPIRTGVTAILPRGHQEEPTLVWGGHFNFNGNGEMTGTHWINEAGYFTTPICITNTHSVGMVHHATVGWMIDNYKKTMREEHSWPMPVIAETYDGLLNDACGRHIKEAHVLAALDTAAGGPIAEGNVGGGTGMVTYDFKGGTGTSSRRIKIDSKDYVIGALVQSNFGLRDQFSVLGVPVGRHITENAVVSNLMGHEHGSIIVIIGTDLPALPSQLQSVAKRAAIGLGRTGSPGGHYSGDIFLAFSVANDLTLPGMADVQPASFSLDFVNEHYLEMIYEATVRSVEEAIVNAMIAAESMTTVKPAGLMLEAIDHERLRGVMRQYERLKE